MWKFIKCFWRSVVVAFLLPNLSISLGQELSKNSNEADAAQSRSDSFETKMRLLEAAWEMRDFDLARSLTNSLRDTIVQTQHEEQSLGESLVETAQLRSVESLDMVWREWARGWKYFKTLSVEETIGEARQSEPIETQTDRRRIR